MDKRKEIIENIKHTISANLEEYISVLNIEDDIARVYGKASSYSAISTIKHTSMTLFIGKVITYEEYKEISSFAQEALDKILDTLNIKDLNEYNIKSNIMNK